jgi:hypothetical protein
MEMHGEEVVGIFLWYEEESLFAVRRLKKYSRRVSAILASGPLHASTRFHPLPETNSTHFEPQHKAPHAEIYYFLYLCTDSTCYFHHIPIITNSIFPNSTGQLPFPWQFFSYLAPQATKRSVHIMSRAVEKAVRHGYYFRLDRAGSI